MTKEFKAKLVPAEPASAGRFRAIANGHLISRPYPEWSATLNSADISYHKIQTWFESIDSMLDLRLERYLFVSGKVHDNHKGYA